MNRTVCIIVLNQGHWAPKQHRSLVSIVKGTIVYICRRLDLELQHFDYEKVDDEEIQLVCRAIIYGDEETADSDTIQDVIHYHLLNNLNPEYESQIETETILE